MLRVCAFSLSLSATLCDAIQYFSPGFLLVCSSFVVSFIFSRFRQGSVGCWVVLHVYYTPSPTASLSFCSISLCLSLYSFSPTTSRLRIEKDGMGEANEEKFPKRKCSPLFPFA